LLGWVLAPEHIVAGLIAMANARGGRDNATAVVVIVGSAPAQGS
jgi:serine/threonine protein phosphatase PrpC